MFIDLLHNYIVRNTITEKFSESVEKKLIPRLEKKHGAALLGIQMYEDHIFDAFYQKGEWYYPLTVILPTGPVTEWIKWRLKSGNFKDSLPYSYIGEGLLDINIAEDVPAEFCAKLSGRAVCKTADTLKINIETPAPDPTILAGRYSQTFVDEMSRQLQDRISSAMQVLGLESSPISLSLVFAPSTYMEHTSENVTYRRLLITDGVSAPRDFWVKWTREDGAMAYSVSDHVNPETVVFEIGEDVPKKVMEKEYRFLIASGGDKYQNAMGRKNITEWRELIKRAVKRGDLVKLEAPDYTASDDEFTARLAAIIGKEPVRESAPIPEAAPENDEFARAMAAARGIIEAKDAEFDAHDAPDVPDVPVSVTEVSFDSETEEITADEPSAVTDIFDTVYDSEIFEEIDDEESLESMEPEEDLMPDMPAAEVPAPEAPKTREAIEAEIRAEIEAKMRLEYETRARLEAEAETEKLRQATEALRRQNEELIRQAEAEKVKIRKEAEARRAEEAKMRAELEEQLRREAKDKERLAEAAKIALREARRDEEEKARAEAMAKAKAEEAARREAEAEKQRRAKEAEALAGHVRSKNYTYTSKSVRFLFRRPVDPNITSRIYEIIKHTLEYYGKDKMYMRIKARIPDATTVILEFVEFPMEEMALLSDIIKILGNSGLGIAKAVVE